MTVPPRFRVRDRQAFKRLRAKYGGKQADCANDAGISAPTLSRLERGENIARDTANGMLDYLEASAHKKGESIGPFEAWFEEISPDLYDWDKIARGAEIVGGKVFRQFRADAILTFPGPSAIFTSLVMAKCLSPEEFLRKSVQVAWFLDNPKKAGSQASSHRGFTKVNRGKWSILVPKALDGADKRMRRAVIIDDCIITGLTLAALKEHLVEHHHYTAERVLGACCVLAPTQIVPWDSRDARAFVAARQDFALPWAVRPRSFEAQLLGSLHIR